VANHFGAQDKIECPKCEGVMSVIRRMPHPTHGALYELQTVECAICSFSEERTVDRESNAPQLCIPLRA
jgi:C4-type Zn-finger protein